MLRYDLDGIFVWLGNIQNPLAKFVLVRLQQFAKLVIQNSAFSFKPITLGSTIELLGSCRPLRNKPKPEI